MFCQSQQEILATQPLLRRRSRGKRDGEYCKNRLSLSLQVGCVWLRRRRRQRSTLLSCQFLCKFDSFLLIFRSFARESTKHGDVTLSTSSNASPRPVPKRPHGEDFVANAKKKKKIQHEYAPVYAYVVHTYLQRRTEREVFPLLNFDILSLPFLPSFFLSLVSVCSIIFQIFILSSVAVRRCCVVLTKISSSSSFQLFYVCGFCGEVRSILAS